ncbi:MULTISPECIES: PepSY domain-containing protein [Nonlabens]|uniref:PepSY-associated transmembrane protein n=1 Tax=Nonlabens xylanidelens TaxID=191564 RepID=A0A2S6IMY5_9FLAO|nr:PepSY domain-containing protein [Nonlabens xylanidelens]PPK95578.1 PepSY-associated transmembrane protein [Nonlabens xylanidelens]PQJ22385.1 hypothetical protein BST94_02090 [Nonlabens xylanidelens]
MGRKTSQKMRELHRHLGFFLAGIMAVYAISGVALIFRDTDALKNEIKIEKTVEARLSKDKVGPALKIKNLKISKEEAGVYYFKGGSYNSITGEASFVKKELPYILDKMTHFHKAKSGEPLFFLNIFFGVSLLFFVISAFWMFMPGTQIFRKGIIFAAAGLVLTLILLFI